LNPIKPCQGRSRRCPKLKKHIKNKLQGWTDFVKKKSKEREREREIKGQNEKLAIRLDIIEQ